MVNYYDELEIEDFAWDAVAKVFHYPCPCGDRFEISKGQLRNGEEIATCPSCSLIVRVVYDYLDYEDYETTDDEGAESENEEQVTPDTSPSPEPTDGDAVLLARMKKLDTKDGQSASTEAATKDDEARDTAGK